MTPRPTAQDLVIWQALIAEATKCVATPERATLTLEKLANKARRAVLPGPPWTPENPYIELRRECARFAGLMAATRIKDRDRLAAALRAVAGDDDGAPEAPWMNRRDIGG